MEKSHFKDVGCTKHTVCIRMSNIWTSSCISLKQFMFFFICMLQAENIILIYINFIAQLNLIYSSRKFLLFCCFAFWCKEEHESFKNLKSRAATFWTNFSKVFGVVEIQIAQYLYDVICAYALAKSLLSISAWLNHIRWVNLTLLSIQSKVNFVHFRTDFIRK